MYFDGRLGQKLILEASGKYLRSLLLLNKTLKKGSICAQYARSSDLYGNKIETGEKNIFNTWE